MTIPAAALALVPALALAIAGPVAAAATPFSVEHLVALERASGPQLSPDERHVVYQLRQTNLEANKGVHGLWLLDLSDKNPTPRRLTAPGSESNTPRWGRDGKLYFLSTRSGSQQVWRIDLAGGEAQPVTQLPLDVGAFTLAPDGSRIALALEVFPECAGDLACTVTRLEGQAASKAKGQLYDKLFVRHWDTWKHGTRSQLFVAPVSGGVAGTPRLVAPFDGDVPTKPFGGDEDFIFTADGRELIFVGRLAGRTEAWSTNTDLWRVPADGSGHAVNLTPEAKGYDFGPVLSPDGRTLAWRSMKRAGFEADRQRIMLRELAGGTARELAPGWDRSADTLAFSADGKSVLVLAEDTGHRAIFEIPLKGGAPRRLTGAGFVESFSAGRHVMAYAQDSLGAPAQVFVADARGRKPRAATRHNEDTMKSVALGAYEQFSFRGWNDETVHGYVMKPANFVPGRKYPVAFLIHGGPQGSFGDHWHYRWNPQTYAGAGYAAVFIDFHGSTGYGQAFTDSISGDWGGKPLVDLQRGWAAALAKHDFLDGSRACALGASYGGYMVNWIAGNWPDGFKCLVNHDGVFDQRAMAYSTEELWFSEWENGGTPFEQPQNYERFNPVNHVAKWRTPMLVIQGGLDYRIPDTQGLSTFTALQRRGIDSQFLFLPNENHWVLKPQNSVQWHHTVTTWLRRWLGP